MLTGSIALRSRAGRYRFAYRAVGGYWRETPETALPTRPGRRSVDVTLRNLRGGARYQYRLIASYRGSARSGRSRTTLAPVRVSMPSHATAAADRTMLWGAELGAQFTGTQPPWDMTPVSDFQRLAGKAPGILPFNIPFINCSGTCTWMWFPAKQLDAIRAYGAIPMVNWSSMSSPIHSTEPGFKLSDVINGTFDAYIRSFAEAAKAWGHPFFLRFNWEMNGNWFPWGEAANSNRPGESAAAWRHVHDIFTSVGATNANWVWCPSIVTTNATVSLRELYPGDRYVDWTCMDGYNWGTSGPHGWASFDQVFSDTYNQITGSIAPSKPMMIGEVGSTDVGGSKAAWISDMFSQLESGYSRIHALLWFDVRDGSMNWPVESSPASAHAFAQGVADSRYGSNTNSNLAGPAIAAP